MTHIIKNKVHVIPPSSGCPMRSLDASKLKKYFYLNNFEVVNTAKDANYIIIVTCSVSPLQFDNSIEKICELENETGEIIVMGCLPGANDIELRNFFLGKAIATKDINGIDKYFPDFRIKFEQVPEANFYNNEAINLISGITYYTSYFKVFFKYGISQSFIRQVFRTYDYKKFKKVNYRYNVEDRCNIVICHGCSNNCTYCNIKKSVGRIRSRSIKSIVEEYMQLLSEGYRLFHFIADDLSSYGLDLNSSLIQLLEELSKVDSKLHVKWSFQGINPSWLVENYKEIVPLIKSKKIWELTIAVESGSDRIIKLMNRKYKIKDVEKVLKSFRKQNRGLRIDALLFAGFPTETDKDFNDTLKFISNVRLDDARTTYYTEFERVASAKIFPKVSNEVVQERCRMARELMIKLKTDVVYGE
jgi:threonylcarbamoyladenosine tRNA methylthiotransferase MtaB